MIDKNLIIHARRADILQLLKLKNTPVHCEGAKDYRIIGTNTSVYRNQYYCHDSINGKLPNQPINTSNNALSFAMYYYGLNFYDAVCALQDIPESESDESDQAGSDKIKMHDSYANSGDISMWVRGTAYRSAARQLDLEPYIKYFYAIPYDLGDKMIMEIDGNNKSRYDIISELGIIIDDNWEHNDDENAIISYLCNDRGLDYEIVRHLINDKLLYQDLRGNCNFIIRDLKYNYIGMEIIGITAKYFRRREYIDADNRNYGFNMQLIEWDGFHMPQIEILFFESAIDLISFWQIYRHKLNHHILISMGGLNRNIIYNIIELKKSGNIEKLNNSRLWVCVDNDDAGFNFIRFMKNEIPDIKIYQPPNGAKDWNELLIGMNY